MGRKAARRTSFCATVNPTEFLNDETGSRRFWVVRPHINLAKVLDLDEEWLIQLWIQVYKKMFLPSPQGFRLTREEQLELQKRILTNTVQYEGLDILYNGMECDKIFSLNLDEKKTWIFSIYWRKKQ